VQTIHSITQANKDFQIDASFVDTDSSISEIRSTVTVDSAYLADFAGTESGPVSEYETPVNRPNLPNLTSEKAQPGILDTQTSRYLQLDARPAAVPSTVEAVIAARNGVGRSLGLEIARTMADGKHQIFVRLDPKELGQLDVRLSFDSSGELRAVVTTTTASSADLIRQDMPSLLRSLSDAGVRVDDRSIRLDLQSGAQSGSGQGHSHKNDQRSRQYPANKEQQQDEDLTYITRRWRAGSQVELRA
jgi:flagellar hook-length control protein FliK